MIKDKLGENWGEYFSIQGLDPEEEEDLVNLARLGLAYRILEKAHRTIRDANNRISDAEITRALKRGGVK